MPTKTNEEIEGRDLDWSRFDTDDLGEARSMQLGAFPSIDRESISWKSVDREQVELSFRVFNEGCESTRPGVAMIEAASFGAFVPNSPVSAIAVGSLDPGEDRTQSVLLNRADLERIAPFPTVGSTEMTQFIDVLVDGASSRHWIGNFNIYFAQLRERYEVERHMAIDLRVPAGKQIGGMFIVDAPCEIRIECDDPDWKPQGLTHHGPIYLIKIKAPAEIGRKANVQVLCVRNADGKTVPVEFQFETVKGWGDSVGCVQV